MQNLKIERKVIVTDVDGILVKWQSGLPYFAQKYQLPISNILSLLVNDSFMAPEDIFMCERDFAVKLMMKYNNSDFIRYLAPYSDAIYTVNKLKKDFDFVAVTALGNSVDAHLNRQFNLNSLFPGAFKEVLVCDHNESKDELLNLVKSKYGQRIICYIDDLASHVESASRVFEFDKVDSIWMPRGADRKKPSLNHIEVKGWKDIYELYSNV